MARKPKLHQKSNEERVSKLSLSKSKSGPKISSKSSHTNSNTPSKRGGFKGGNVVKGNTVVVKTEFAMAGRMKSGVRMSAKEIGQSSARLANYMENHGAKDLELEDEKNKTEGLSALYQENGSRMTDNEHKDLMKDFSKEEGVQSNRVFIIDNGSHMSRDEMHKQVMETMTKFQEETGKDLNYKFAIHTDKQDVGGNIHAHVLVTGSNKDINMTKEQLSTFKTITADSAKSIMEERNFFEKMEVRRIEKELERLKEVHQKENEKVQDNTKDEVKAMLESLKGAKVSNDKPDEKSFQKDKNEQVIIKVERTGREIDSKEVFSQLKDISTKRNEAKKENNEDKYRDEQHKFFNTITVKEEGFNKKDLQNYIDKSVADKDNHMTKETGEQYMKNMEEHVKKLESAGFLEKEKNTDNYKFVDSKAKEILFDNSEKSFNDLAKQNIHEYKKAVEESQNKDSNKDAEKAQNSEKSSITIRTDSKTFDEVKDEKKKETKAEEKEVYREKITRITDFNAYSKETSDDISEKIIKSRQDRDALAHLNKGSEAHKHEQEKFFNLQMVSRDGYNPREAENFAKVSIEKGYMKEKDANQFLKNSQEQADKMKAAGILEKNKHGEYHFVDTKAQEVLYKNHDKSSNEIAKENVKEFNKSVKLFSEMKEEDKQMKEKEMNKHLTHEQQIDKLLDGKLDQKQNVFQH